MPTHPRTIVEMARQREQQRADYMADHGRIRRVLEGDASVFMELLVGHEINPTPVPGHMTIPNLLLNAGNALARRIANPPVIADRAANPDSKTAVKMADIGTKVKQFWWQRNQMHLTGYQIARYLLAYSEAPIIVRPDPKLGIPCFEERDPLSAYPSDTDSWRPTPDNCIFRWRQYLGVLRARYPAAHDIQGPDDQQVECFEFLDDGEWTLVAQGSARPGSFHTPDPVLLESIPNRIGEPMFVVPRLIGFGQRQGDFNQLVGLLANQARLTILMLMAAERQVFPDTFIAGGVVGNSVNLGPDGVTLLEQGSTVARLAYNSGFQFLQELDRLERSIRVGASFPAQFSGETPTSLATGRGNQLLIGATIDEGVKERQQILATSYTLLLEKAVKIDRAGYWPASERKHITLDLEGGRSQTLSYVPEKIPVGTTRVEYGLLSAADAAQATVMIGQKVGIGMLSLEGAMELDPFIPDPTTERERIKNESLDKAMLEGLQQQVIAGTLDPRTISRIKKLVRQGADLEDAIEQAIPEAAAAGELLGPEMAGADFGQGVPGLPAGPKPIEQILGQLTSGGAGTIMSRQITPV